MMARVLALVALMPLACGGSNAKDPSASNAPATATSPRAATVDAPPAKITSISRAQVKTTIQRGVGYFLQNVTVDASLREGKFVGWSIQKMNPEWGLDIQPGDVVTRVNGLSIEHPEDADTALRSLDKAKSLKVDYERAGKPRSFELPITD